MMAPMLALNYHPSIPRIVSTKLLGAVRPRLYTGALPTRLSRS